MKKIIFILSVFLFFLFFPLDINAQILTPTPFLITLPGDNCGIADDPNKNRCCQLYRPEFELPELPGALSILIPIFGPGKELLEKDIIQPLRNTFSNLGSPCLSGAATTPDPMDPSCKCINPVPTQAESLTALNNFCQKQFYQKDRDACLNCINSGGVYSGIGCIQTDLKQFIQKVVFSWGIGLAGGFALLCIIYAAFQMQSSQGNPEKLKKAQELITSCIMGLMLIIFSVFILRLIGISILKIPGFS